MEDQEAMKKQMNAARETAKRAQIRAEDALSRALDDKEITEATTHRRFSELKRRWDETQQAHDNLVVECMADSSKEGILIEDEFINKLADKFYELEVKTDNLLAKKQQQQQHRQQVLNSKCAKNVLKLEPLKFDRFDGSLRRFPRFKFEFETHIAPLCTEEQLPIVLRSYLTPAVQQDVENMDNINDMWQRLVEKYVDCQKLIDDILSDIASLDSDSSRSSSDESALEMIHTIERAHQDLVRLKEESEMNNATILSKIENHMPSQMFGEWIKEAVTLSNQQNISDFSPSCRVGESV